MMLCGLPPYAQNALLSPQRGSGRAFLAHSARNFYSCFKCGLALSDTEHDRHRKGAILFIV